jgi:hypothetical protein
VVSTLVVSASPTNSHMSQQIFVLKQGSKQKDSWSSRILTIDTATATATVSRRNQPSKVLHHTIRVNEIRKFPNVDLVHTKVNPNSIEAKWTLCLLGYKAPVPKLETARRVQKVDAHHNRKHDGAAEDKPSSESSDSVSNSDKHAKKSPVSKRKGGAEVLDHWLIQCTSQDTYDLAVKLLEEITHAKDKVEVNSAHDASNPAEKDLAIIPPPSGALAVPISHSPVAAA